jgi:hypothetical protein
MSETIKCEITNVKMFDNRASVSIKAMGELPTDLENSKSYSDQYGLQYSQFLNDGDLPPYVKVGTKIAIPYYVNKNGYMALSQYDEVKVLEEANVVDEIKQAFPNATVETIKGEDDKETDFPYGANKKALNGHSVSNLYSAKAQGMQDAFDACKDKEFFKFFGRDLDALQKLVVTVFLSNR